MKCNWIPRIAITNIKYNYNQQEKRQRMREAGKGPQRKLLFQFHKASKPKYKKKSTSLISVLVMRDFFACSNFFFAFSSVSVG